MSGFDLVFAVYGLILGLAVTEVLGGFAGIWKLKRGTRPIKVGWLTPLLGIVVMLDLTSFWLLAWETRNQIGANYLTLVSVLGIVGVYYLAASLIFPDEPEEWPDFNDWYDKQNRAVIGGLLAANVGSWIGMITLEEVSPTPAAQLAQVSDAALMVEAIGGLGILALLIALLKVKGRRANVAMLVGLIALMFVSGVGSDLL